MLVMDSNENIMMEIMDEKPFMALDSRFCWADVSEDIRARAIAQGICARTIPCDARSTVYALPVTCFPSKIDPKCFDLATEMQACMNSILHNIAINHQFLEEHLSTSTDPFVQKLYQIYDISRKNLDTQSTNIYQLGIFRTDYMIDIEKKLKQVENNTISVSFGGMSQEVTELHRYSVQNYQPTIKNNEATQNIPKNPSCSAIAEALVETDLKYNNCVKNPTAILFLIQENESNIMDQKLIEWEIKRISKGRILVFRRTFEELDQARNLWLGQSNELILKVYNKSQHTIVSQEISIVYYRTGYKWEDYLYPGSWRIRQRIEESKAVKCPSIQYQLAGLKQIQFLLSDQEIFNKFIEDEYLQISQSLFETFTNFYKIDNKSIKLVKKDPTKFVLKSNQEGGGHNFFGEKIIEQLEKMSEQEKQHHFLMEFIEQDSYYTEFVIEKEKNTILEINEEEEERRPGYELPNCELQDELGIFGCILANYNKNVLFNRKVGHLLRSKPTNRNEAGILAGSGVLNSPYLDLPPPPDEEKNKEKNKQENNQQTDK